MAFNNEKCGHCGRTLANTKFTVGESTLCPICWLGEKEGSKSKYWETSQAKNAGKAAGFTYPEDNGTLVWDKKERKWVEKEKAKK